MPTLSTTRKAAAAVEKKKRKHESANDESSDPQKKKKVRKICRTPGCTNQVKRGGVCIRHGAKEKTKLCSIDKRSANGTAASNDNTEKSVPPKKKNKTANTKRSSAASTTTAAASSSNADSTTGGNGLKTTKSTEKSKEKTTKNSSQQTSPTWEEMFYKLVLFQANNSGSTIVPYDGESKVLAKWVANERLLYRQSLRGRVLSQEETGHMKALQQIGFVFEGRTNLHPNSERNNENWMKRYQELIEYERINGTFNPPTNGKRDLNEFSIGAWCDNQRNAYREYRALVKVFATKYANHPPLNPEDIASIKGSNDPKESGMSYFITKERIDKLHALEGFQWEFRPPITPFEQRLEEYKEFQKNEGHGLVPQHYKDNRPLGKWVARLRCDYKALREGKKSTLTPERLAQLEAINFEFCYGDPRGIKSKKKFEESREKHEEEEDS
jgi:hypothetical protein